jgi:retron-type reverse transcriptase
MPEMKRFNRTVGEGVSRTAHTYVPEESDSGVLPMNRSNKDGKPLAENEEGRPLVKENIHQPSTRPTQSGVRVSQGLLGVRKAAKERKENKFTALLHHLTVALLRDSFYALKRRAAPGVDGVMWTEYETELEGHLIDLHSRVHRGAYRAQPSRRVYIPKPDGRQRPLGVTALEDKIVQQGVLTILNQIYEEDFRGFSYGFRPRRSQHQALDALYIAITRKKVSFVLDADIRGFFDNLDRGWLLKFFQHRVADTRMLRLIQKWLGAGVIEEGSWKDTGMGTPQGSVITPLTQKVISSSNGQLRDGEQGTLYLIYVLRSNMFMAYDAIDQSGEGSAAERRSWPTPASCCTSRSSAALVTRIRVVRASSVPLLRGGLPARSTSRSYRGHGADHVEASAAHSGTAAEVREKQWPFYWSDRDRRVERVSRHSEETWLSRAPRAAHFKSVLTMLLIDCTMQSSLRPTVFWCRFGSVPSAVV